MDLATYRSSLGISQEQCALALGLSGSSKSWISDIEKGNRPASLHLALKIEKWSGGQVKAGDLSAVAAKLAAPAQREAAR